MSASANFPSLPANWKEETLNFENESLFMRIWSNPNGQTGRALFVVHGWGEQSDRYTHLPHYLRTSFDAIAAIDLPGHGKSKGQRGHIDNYDQMVNAAVEGFHAFEEWLSNKGTPKQMHWLGHSFGGLTTLHVMNRHPDLALRSVIVSAPLLDLSMPVPKLKKFFGELIAPILPKLPLANEIDGASISHDPSVIEAYRGNPLNHASITPRGFVQMNQAMLGARTQISSLPYSMILLLPLDDKIVSGPTAFKFWQALKVSDGKKKELQMWPGTYHESMNDVNKGAVFNAIENWVAKN